VTRFMAIRAADEMEGQEEDKKNGAHFISDYYSKKRQNMDTPDTSAGTSKNEKINKGQLAIRNPLPPSLTIPRSEQQCEMSRRHFALVVYIHIYDVFLKYYY